MMLHLAFLQEEYEEVEALLNTPIEEPTPEQEALTQRAFQKAMALSEKQRKEAAHKRRMSIARSIESRAAGLWRIGGSIFPR